MAKSRVRAGKNVQGLGPQPSPFAVPPWMVPYMRNEIFMFDPKPERDYRKPRPDEKPTVIDVGESANPFATAPTQVAGPVIPFVQAAEKIARRSPAAARLLEGLASKVSNPFEGLTPSAQPLEPGKPQVPGEVISESQGLAKKRHERSLQRMRELNFKAENEGKLTVEKITKPPTEANTNLLEELSDAKFEKLTGKTKSAFQKSPSKGLLGEDIEFIENLSNRRDAARREVESFGKPKAVTPENQVETRLRNGLQEKGFRFHPPIVLVDTVMESFAGPGIEGFMTYNPMNGGTELTIPDGKNFVDLPFQNKRQALAFLEWLSKGEYEIDVNFFPRMRRTLMEQMGLQEGQSPLD